jgi:hypothetical protein
MPARDLAAVPPLLHRSSLATLWISLTDGIKKRGRGPRSSAGGAAPRRCLRDAGHRIRPPPSTARHGVEVKERKAERGRAAVSCCGRRPSSSPAPRWPRTCHPAAAASGRREAGAGKNGPRVSGEPAEWFLFRREAWIAVGSPSTKMNGQEHPVFLGPVSAQEGLARRPLRRPARWLSGLRSRRLANEAKQVRSAACSCYAAHQSGLGRGLRWTR